VVDRSVIKFPAFWFEPDAKAFAEVPLPADAVDEGAALRPPAADALPVDADESP